MQSTHFEQCNISLVILNFRFRSFKYFEGRPFPLNIRSDYKMNELCNSIFIFSLSLLSSSHHFIHNLYHYLRYYFDSSLELQRFTNRVSLIQSFPNCFVTMTEMH